MKRSLVSLSDVKRLLLIVLIGFVFWLGVYNWIVLGDAGDVVKAVLFALVLLARDLIKAVQTLRNAVQTPPGLRARIYGQRKPVEA